VAAWAADLPVKALPPTVVPYSWTGFYVGGHSGGAWKSTSFSDPFGAAIFGDKVASPGYAAGGQIGYNWQAPGSQWVLGVEADASLIDADGTNTCFAFSGFFLSMNCRVRDSWTGTLTGRVGVATGPGGKTLLYAKGGAAAIHETIDIATNALVPPLATSTTFTKWGWTAGVGVEQALTPAWSFKAEYDYLSFGNTNVAFPPSFQQIFPPINLYTIIPGGLAAVSQNVHEVKLGLNYRFGADPWATWNAAAAPVPYVTKAPVLAGWAPGWEFEGGGRYWYSSGKFQKDLGSGFTANVQNVLNSRLTYDTTAHSGELFGRVDSPVGIFLKGFAGLGTIASGGTLNDEDWLLFAATVPYSNTTSTTDGNIGYATVDLGYDVMRGPTYKYGYFIGYNYYKEDKNASGCVQIANLFSDCVPPIPNSVLAITEDDKWQALRIGASGEFMLFDRVKLTTDAAYLPYVKFTGTDNHVLRSIVSPEWGTGRGFQLEAILSYYVTPNFTIGAGGRYWAMWTTDAFTAFGGGPCPCQTLPSKTERYGVLFQAAYKFDQPAPAAAPLVTKN
jgi:opacity protein-like surface antigen